MELFEQLNDQQAEKMTGGSNGNSAVLFINDSGGEVTLIVVPNKAATSKLGDLALPESMPAEIGDGQIIVRDFVR